MPYDAYRLSKAILNNFYYGMISSITDSMHCKIVQSCDSHKPVCTMYLAAENSSMWKWILSGRLNSWLSVLVASGLTCESAWVLVNTHQASTGF